MHIIDADAHVSIPEEMFLERLPAKIRDRRPKLLLIDGEKHFWMVEGRLVPKPAGRGAGTPRGFTPRGAPKDHYLDNLQGRLEDMDKEGIQIQVLYPDLIMVDPEIEDAELACGMARAYNDYVAERCKSVSDRLKRIGVVALQDPKEAANELRRSVTELGCVGVVIPAMMGHRLLCHRDFEVFFDEASALGIAIAIHAVTGVYSMPWQDLFSNNFGSHMVAMPLAYMVALTSIFDGNMMERYPKIRLSFMEGGCGWAPYWIRRLDEHIAARKRELHHALASEYVKTGRLFFGCEPGEYHLPQVVRELGDECLLYSSDYPHGDTKWPNTVRLMNEVKGLSQEARAKILGSNAALFYGWAAE